MPQYCAVPGCKNRKGGHVFPSRSKSPVRRRAWVYAIKRGTPGKPSEPWEPSNNSVVCRDHFLPGDYKEYLYYEVVGRNRLNRLKEGVVPSYFFNQKLQSSHHKLKTVLTKTIVPVPWTSYAEAAESCWTCAVNGCKSDARKYTNLDFFPWMSSISFYSFPPSNFEISASLRGKWIRALRKPASWQPGPEQRVCSLHFSHNMPTPQRPIPDIFPWGQVVPDMSDNAQDEEMLFNGCVENTPTQSFDSLMPTVTLDQNVKEETILENPIGEAAACRLVLEQNESHEIPNSLGPTSSNPRLIEEKAITTGSHIVMKNFHKLPKESSIKQSTPSKTFVGRPNITGRSLLDASCRGSEVKSLPITEGCTEKPQAVQIGTARMINLKSITGITVNMKQSVQTEVIKNQSRSSVLSYSTTSKQMSQTKTTSNHKKTTVHVVPSRMKEDAAVKGAIHKIHGINLQSVSEINPGGKDPLNSAKIITLGIPGLDKHLDLKNENHVIQHSNCVRNKRQDSNRFVTSQLNNITGCKTLTVLKQTEEIPPTSDLVDSACSESGEPIMVKDVIPSLKDGMCDKSFEGEDDMDKHLKDHSVNRNICDNVSTGASIDQISVEITGDQALLKANNNELVSDRVSGSKSFQTTEAETDAPAPQTYECTICSVVCKSEGEWLKHVSEAHKRQSDSHIFTLVCSFCGLRLENQRHYFDHIFLKHKVQAKFRKNTAYRPNTTCNFCSKTFASQCEMVAHKAKFHPPTDPVPCEICGKVFPNAYPLKRHMQTHSGRKDFMCAFCGKKFSKKTHLQFHEKLHTDTTKNEICDICGKAFARKQYLRYHKQRCVVQVDKLEKGEKLRGKKKSKTKLKKTIT